MLEEKIGENGIFDNINDKKIKSKLIKMYSIGAIWGDDSNPAIASGEEKWDI